MTASEGAGRPAERPAAEAGTASGAELSPRGAAAGNTQETAPLTGSIAAAPDDAQQLVQEIERTRERLGETVQELAARADVKGRARAKTAEVTERVKSTTAQARRNATARAGSLRSQVASMTTAARQKAISVSEAGKDQKSWIPLAIASGVLFTVYLTLRRWGRQ